ncbi:MAG: hypothetical protein ACLRRT_14040 [Ruthenibacterium lactatiformans]
MTYDVLRADVYLGVHAAHAYHHPGGDGAFYYFVYAQGGGGKAMNVGRAKVKDQADQGRKATFADVAGADEEKAGRNCGVLKPAAL